MQHNLRHSTYIKDLRGQLVFVQPKTRPATAAVLLSLVTVFFRPFPAWIWPSSAPTVGEPPPLAVRVRDARRAELLSIGGGGGAEDPGIGGGGGAAVGAPNSGIGGGGGGGGAPGTDSKAAGTDGESCTGVGGLL